MEKLKLNCVYGEHIITTELKGKKRLDSRLFVERKSSEERGKSGAVSSNLQQGNMKIKPIHLRSINNLNGLINVICR